MTRQEMWDNDQGRSIYRALGPALYRMAYDGWVAAWEDPFQLKREAARPDAFTASPEVLR